MTIPMVFNVEFISLLIAAIAATQGVYNNVNTRKLVAERTVNNVPRAADTCAAFVPSKTLSVETTASFAVIPVRNSPICKTKWFKNWRDQMSKHCKQTICAVCYNIQSAVKCL